MVQPKLLIVTVPKQNGAMAGNASSNPIVMTPLGPSPVCADHRGGVEFGPFLEAMRLLQDKFTGAVVPGDLEVRLTAKIAALATELDGYQVPDAHRVVGYRPDLPGRGSLLVPPYLVDEQTDSTMRGRVTFTRFHLGGNGAIHGGTVPLLFDAVLGKVANHAMPGVARTVNLVVDYRVVTPVNVEVLFVASRDRVQGRKRFTSARLTSAEGVLLTEARGIFVELNPGQQ